MRNVLLRNITNIDVVATVKHGRKYTIFVVKVPNQVFKLREVAEVPN